MVRYNINVTETKGASMDLITLKTTCWYVRPSGEKRVVQTDITKDIPQKRLKLILSDTEIQRLKEEGHVIVKMIGEVYFKHEVI